MVVDLDQKDRLRNWTGPPYPSAQFMERIARVNGIAVLVELCGRCGGKDFYASGCSIILPF